MIYRQANNNILDEIKESFRNGSTLTKLIYINLGVFILVKLAAVIYSLVVPQSTSVFDQMTNRGGSFTYDILQYLMVSSDFMEVVMRPWTLLTYMFLHEGFLHILGNMLWLFWFGRIFLHYLNQKQLLTTYLVGGLFGAGLYILFYFIFPGLTYGIMLGASASVTAIVMAISFYVPDYTIRLFFVGEVKLKHLALVYILIDILQMSGGNAAGHIAHLGGAIYGYLFAMQLKRGKDIGKGFSAFSDSVATIFKRKPKMKVTYKSNARNMTDLDYNKSKAETQEEMDRILDKIAKSGYNSLSKKEKELLFKMGGKK